MISTCRDRVIKFQTEQTFGSFRGEKNEKDFSSFQLLPNQFAYMIDCKRAEVCQVTGNLKQHTGIEKQELTISHIYNSLHQSVLDDFFIDVADGFELITQDPISTLPFRNGLSHINTIKKVGNGYHTFHRSAWIWEGDEQGIFTKTISIFTYLYHGRCNATHANMTGPESQFFRANYLRKFKSLCSNRELEVLKLIADGYRTPQIADKLFISKLTVETHRKNMIRKLEAYNTPHLVAIAKDIGLI